jgi:dipeptide/tripeptide permease
MKKNILKILKILTMVLVIGLLAVTVAADEPANGTTTMTTLVSIVFWAVRLIILAVGVVPAVIKIVQGQSDENTRDRNAGIATIIIAGICFAATFPLATLFTSPASFSL